MKHKYIITTITLLTLCGLAIFNQSCNVVAVKFGQHNLEKKIAIPDSITTINNEGNIDIEFTQGEPSAVLVYPDWIIPSDFMKIEGNVIHIYPLDSDIIVCGGSNNITLRISLPNLDIIYLEGSGDFNATSSISNDNKILIAQYGTGDISIPNINAPVISISAFGVGDTQINTLRTKDLYISLNGNGDIDILNLKSDNIDAKIAGSGDVALREMEAINSVFTLDGSGSLVLSGKSKRVEYKGTGSGEIIETEFNSTQRINNHSN